MRECVVCKRVFGDHVVNCDRDHTPLKTTLPISPLLCSYRLDERIGTGSLGIVYRGAQIGQNIPLAIKVISPEIAQSAPNIANIFLSEAYSIMQVNHPNIINVHDFNQADNATLFLVMEYLEGRTLQKILTEELQIPIDMSCNIMLQLCEAMSVMHKQDKLHHNLKPSDIFIVYDKEGKEHIKVLDFGLAKIKNQELCNVLPGARTQNFFNLPFYVSPEECDGQEITKASEIYTLGAIFYHLLTGQPPFLANSHRELMYKHINEPVVLPRMVNRNIPESIESIVLSCLHKSPSDRFSSPLTIINLLNLAIKSGVISSAKSNFFSPKILPTTTGSAPQLEEAFSQDLPPQKTSSEIFASKMPKQPQSNLKITNKLNTLAFGEVSSKVSMDINPKLTLMTRILSDALKTSEFLSESDIDPYKIVSQLSQQIQANAISKDNVLFAPNLIKIFVPRTSTKKFQEIESIFNSSAFISNTYKYTREAGYRLFSEIKIEIEIVHPQAQGYEGCNLQAGWPLASDISNGLERIILVDAQKIVKMQMPVIKVSKVALLQPINGTTYANYHLIVQPITYLGRFRNVVNLENSQLIRRNDVSFLQPNNPSSPNTTVSRQHAKIEFLDGNFYLYDTGSTNGTKINRRENNNRNQIPVNPNSDGVLLLHRDVIQLGSTLLSFEIVPSEKVADLIDQLTAELELQHLQLGSNAEAYRTMAATSSMSSSVVW